MCTFIFFFCYPDEPCFDTEIEMVLKDDVHTTVPKIVVDCCQLIEEKYRKSTEPIEGIYRQCGDYNKMQALRFSIDANNYNALRQPNVDIHTLAGVLKLFLREIKSPLVSTNEAKTFIGKPNQWGKWFKSKLYGYNKRIFGQLNFPLAVKQMLF